MCLERLVKPLFLDFFEGFVGLVLGKKLLPSDLFFKKESLLALDLTFSW